MIEVTIYKTKDKYKGFMVEGHSSYAEEGFDIVCASVSILSYTALNSLNVVAGLSPEYIEYHVDENTGLMNLKTLSMDYKTDIVYRCFEVGIRLLLEDYGEYITLKFKEV